MRIPSSGSVRFRSFMVGWEQNIEEEDAPLSNKEKILLKKAVFWSRIRYGVAVVMGIRMLFIILY